MDVATLGFAIDTEGLKEANKELDAMPPKAKRVKTQYDIMESSATAAAKSAQASAKATADSMKQIESAAKAAATETQKVATVTAASEAKKRSRGQYDLPNAAASAASLPKFITAANTATKATQALAVQQGIAATNMAAAAQASASLVANLPRVAGGASLVTREMEKLQRFSLTRMFGEAGESASNFLATFARGGVAFNAFALAALAAGAAAKWVIDYGEKVQGSISEMLKLANAHGLTTDEVQALQAEAKRSGQTFDQVYDSIGKNVLALRTLTETFVSTGQAIDHNITAKVAKMEQRTKEATDRMEVYFNKIRAWIASIYVERKADFLESAAGYIEQMARAINSIDIRKLILLTSPLTIGKAVSGLQSEDMSIASGEGVKKAEENLARAQKVLEDRKKLVAQESVIDKIGRRVFGTNTGGAEEEVANAEKALAAAKALQERTRAEIGYGRSKGYGGTEPAMGTVSVETPKAEEIKAVGSAVKESTKDFDAQAQAFEKHKEGLDAVIMKGTEFIEKQNLERDTLTMTAEEAAIARAQYDLLSDAKQRGLTLSAEETERLKKLGTEMGQTAVATERYKEIVEGAKEMTKSFVKDTLQGLREGQTIWESFGNAAVNALNKIASKLMDMAINNLFEAAFGGGKGGGGKGGGGGGGMFGSLLGSIFDSLFTSIMGSPFMAEGGNYNPGKPRIVGEEGIEFDIPRNGGTIMNQDQMAEALAGAGGGGVTVVQNNKFGSDVNRSELAVWARTIKKEAQDGAFQALMDDRRRSGESKRTFSR